MGEMCPLELSGKPLKGRGMFFAIPPSAGLNADMMARVGAAFLNHEVEVLCQGQWGSRRDGTKIHGDS